MEGVQVVREVFSNLINCIRHYLSEFATKLYMESHDCTTESTSFIRIRTPKHATGNREEFGHAYMKNTVLQFLNKIEGTER